MQRSLARCSSWAKAPLFIERCQQLQFRRQTWLGLAHPLAKACQCLTGMDLMAVALQQLQGLIEAAAGAIFRVQPRPPEGG